MRIWLIAPLLALAACSDRASEAGLEAAKLRFERVSPDPVEHGERLISVLGCTGCHNPELTGEDWTEPDMGVLWTANLTQSAAKFSHTELGAMITQGKRSDRALMDMPSFLFDPLHPEDVAALVAYLKTLEPKGEAHPEPTIGPRLRREIDSGDWLNSAQDVAQKREKGPPDLGLQHAFGRFVLRTTCVECHGMDLRGSDAPFPDAPARPDLRIAAAYSAEDFAHFMKTGEAAGGRELELMSAVARRRYSRFTPGEVEAIFAYLSELARRDP